MATQAQIEAGLLGWLQSASGYAAGQVIFAHQSANRPSGDFITISLQSSTPVGIDEVEYSVHGNGNGGLGTDLTYTVKGIREFTASVQAFTSATLGVSCARAILEKCVAALALPSPITALESAGITITSSGTVESINEIVGTKYEGRAVLNIRGQYLTTASENGPSIEKVETHNYIGPPLGTWDEIDIP